MKYSSEMEYWIEILIFRFGSRPFLNASVVGDEPHKPSARPCFTKPLSSLLFQARRGPGVLCSIFGSVRPRSEPEPGLRGSKLSVWLVEDNGQETWRNGLSLLSDEAASASTPSSLLTAQMGSPLHLGQYQSDCPLTNTCTPTSTYFPGIKN